MQRLSNLSTLRIRPERTVTLTYQYRTFKGVEGDTVASLLYANGIRIFTRSLKYHRPRGLYSLDGECSNALMEVNGVPNVRVENTMAKNGMQVRLQNVFGSAGFDVMGFMDWVDWAMPAGFYYRRFHKPERLWPLMIKLIRKMAGLGKINPEFKMPAQFDEIYPTTDVCVIGGGPAGMTAALAAAGQGLRVILLESRPWLGGCFDYRTVSYNNGRTLSERARELTDEVDGTENIRVFRHTAVVGTYADNLVTAFQKGDKTDVFDERYVEIRSKSIVVATGCIERPLLFENNERPGVMQIGCAHRLARTWGILPGKRMVFSIGHDLGKETALDLSDLGAEILCVADIREDGHDPDLEHELRKRNIPFYRGWTVSKVRGRKTLNKVRLSTLNGSHHREFTCDTLVASAGLTPVNGPLNLAGASFAYNDRTGFFKPDRLPKNIHAAGWMLGLHHPKSIETSGRLAGLAAASDCGASVHDFLQEAEAALSELPGPVRGSKLTAAPGCGKKTFICFDEDGTLKHVDQALEMGFDVPELIKRFTAIGTGPGQGGIPGHNLPLYVDRICQTDKPSPQPTTVRPPLVPTLLATYAGRKIDMCKRTPLHTLQVEAGGRMERIGVWKRARYFSPDKDIQQEVDAVRRSVGMLDASTLGKFRLFGPDALKILQRVYVSDMSQIQENKIKYAAMCNDDGCLIDDGVVIKRHENDYYFTTSTGRAGVTAEWIRYHTRYDDWEFYLVNLTDAFGVINLAGPLARKVLSKITDVDLSNDAFPFTGYREFYIKEEIPVRAMRLGFVGELSYERHLPSCRNPKSRSGMFISRYNIPTGQPVKCRIIILRPVKPPAARLNGI